MSAASSEKVVQKVNAHVFKIGDDKKSWVPLGKPASIVVMIRHDESRNKFRVVAMNGTEAVINSNIQPDMKFSKTSAKFGQWNDSFASTLYGIGFATEDLLDGFKAAFEAGVEARPKPAPAPKQRMPSMAGAAASPAGADGAAGAPSSEMMTQLKYENERLKIALNTSATNAKRWEQELQTLKNNNARLKTALQESAGNVAEWKTQLTAWKEECIRLRAQNKDLKEKGGSAAAAQSSDLKAQIDTLRSQLEQAEVDKATAQTAASVSPQRRRGFAPTASTGCPSQECVCPAQPC
mmetsp:Transcript_25293/g.66136  ORF Transcript_25293/g.66136 Transcript_25293/m.66136 type:complete len:294 (+) Transcript_25293:254-1135(+)